MSKLSLNKEMVSKNKKKIISCSTPEHKADSPSRDSDSLCDSEAASPVPFLCTQDGAEGETDVVWNFYTPTSKNAAKIRQNESTPLSRKSKRSLRQKLIEKPPPKRRGIKPSQKKTELFQELLELKQNLQELIPKKTEEIKKEKTSGSEDDIFSDTQEYSPKTNWRLTSHSLRKNLLSSNYKVDTDNALESDDSMNECLLKVSQVVEEVLLKQDVIPHKRSFNDSRKHSNMREINADLKFKIDHDSMDAILNSIQLDSPVIKKIKCDSPKLNNDSFDSFVGNLNDSELDRLTQCPMKSESIRKRNISKEAKDWSVKELVVHESPSKSTFGRHNSMPESPSLHNFNHQPSTSGMAFGRYKSMPHGNDKCGVTESDLSPIRCTPDEIKKKHQVAREKLMAKRLLPFTTQSTQPIQSTQSKTKQFKLKIPSPRAKVTTNTINVNVPQVEEKINTQAVDMKSIIEKKRQEALMRLKKRQLQSKIM
ncbi:hypothetical protein K1T71_010917 [Dendrolimus kikuchii]|uniref:Uncharacterized protein n=1 Tax=Dendrolimus kikuchii TaxID=765133 RepID=A0ACC1CQ93_9NEOP|nr:hypothetical protein K1T71_010917 [Dendrolimus kikuchii]